MPDKDVPWLLLERYYAGACTPEEQAALDSWLAGDPRRRLLVERLRTVLTDTTPTLSQSDIERAWTRLETTINPNPGRSFPIVALLAAGVLALLGIAWLVARYVTH
jgi:ferric-dicitrate binding protein FerR (iron transport regulator)